MCAPALKKMSVCRFSTYGFTVVIHYSHFRLFATHLIAIAVLWIEFVREVRWCWEESQPLPRMPVNGTIDLSTCLINQKLHMVGFCYTNYILLDVIAPLLNLLNHVPSSPFICVTICFPVDLIIILFLH